MGLIDFVTSFFGGSDDDEYDGQWYSLNDDVEDDENTTSLEDTDDEPLDVMQHDEVDVSEPIEEETASMMDEQFESEIEDNADKEGTLEDEPLTSVNGIGQAKAANLRENGIESPLDVRNAEDQELLEVNGIGEHVLEQIRDDVGYKVA